MVVLLAWRAPALDDGAVRCGCGPLHCEAVRSRAKLLGPRRALMEIQYYSKLHSQQLILEDGEIFWILTLDRENMIYQQMFQPFMVSSNLITYKGKPSHGS